MESNLNPDSKRSRGNSVSSVMSEPDSPNVELATPALDHLVGIARRKGTDLTDSQSTGACSSAQEASETEFGLSASPADRDSQPLFALADNLASMIRDAAQRTSELATSGASNTVSKYSLLLSRASVEIRT